MGQAVTAGLTALAVRIAIPGAIAVRADAIVQTTALADPSANAVLNFCPMELAIARMDVDVDPIANVLGNVSAVQKIRKWSVPNRATTKQNQGRRSSVAVAPNVDAALSADAVHPADARR